MGPCAKPHEAPARSHSQDRRGRLRDMVSIHDRPVEVQGRQVAGHSKGDLIKGAGNASAVGTLVERKSRFVLLAKVDRPDAESVLRGFTRRPAHPAGEPAHRP